MLMFYPSTIVRLFSILVLSVVVACVLPDNLLADADEDYIAQLKGWKVSVAPASFSYDDEITITISGLPRNFPFDKNALTLNGLRFFQEDKKSNAEAEWTKAIKFTTNLSERRVLEEAIKGLNQ